MPQPSTVIQIRELRLASLPAGQGPLVMAWLGRLPGLEMSQNGPLTLTIRYAAGRYRMSELRQLLTDAGFHPDNSLWSRLRLALYDYSDQLARHNLAQPASRSYSREAYARIYQQHLHGDHDDTPEELRHDS